MHPYKRQWQLLFNFFKSTVDQQLTGFGNQSYIFLFPFKIKNILQPVFCLSVLPDFTKKYSFSGMETGAGNRFLVAKMRLYFLG